ncbi:MAG TPA: hypothetical protein VJS39_07875, partial [Gemmatimonadaceae bacterium]|nr:hypothetical protein [Gemmatimonadaceae bacterium]
RDLTRYLVAAFRNRARRGHRDSSRRDSYTGAASSEIGTAQQRIVAECISEYTFASSGTSEIVTPSRGVIVGLAQRVSTELSADEMKMMVGIGRHLPLREIAGQLQISYGAARVRVHRLRERFRRIAGEYVATLAPEQKNEITRFFRRAEFELMPSTSNNPSAQPVLREQSQ